MPTGSSSRSPQSRLWVGSRVAVIAICLSLGLGGFNGLRAQGTISAPNLVEPVDGSWHYVQICLSWESVPAAISYRLQVAPEGEAFVERILDITTNGTFVCDIIEDGFYMWRVLANGSVASSDWSEVWHFETRFPVDIQSLPSGASQLDVGIYPNPFSSQATIWLRIPAATAITVSIYDSFGRDVSTILAGTMLGGEYRIPWRPLDLSSGAYLLSIQSRDQVVTKVVSHVQH